eukprot:Skav217087  [mRNA]  locus=scaffold2169:21126:27176:- [translate_table: standard]
MCASSAVEARMGDAPDQLRCYALAQQATVGDAPDAKRFFPSDTQKSWETCRGMAKAEASERLVQELVEKDPSFRKARSAEADIDGAGGDEWL